MTGKIMTGTDAAATVVTESSSDAGLDPDWGGGGGSKREKKERGGKERR